jgi:hypothetical protein
MGDALPMHRSPIRPLALALALLASPAAATPGAPADPGAQCMEAIRLAERERGLPNGLLGAIAQVESGRRHPATGRVTPWPWTINAEGQGRYFDSRQAAIAEVQALRARGVTIIDVGCMQVNLFHHPRAFANLDEAFDPISNARYAARFLRELNDSRKDWAVSAGHYHSNTPDRAEVYRARVMAVWTGQPYRTNDPRALMVEAWAATRQQGSRVGLAVAASTLSSQTERARALPGAAGFGREYDMLRISRPQQARARPTYVVRMADARDQRGTSR